MGNNNCRGGVSPPVHHSPRRNAFTDNPSVLLRNPPPFTQGRLPPLRHLSVPPLPEGEAHTVGERFPIPPSLTGSPQPSPHSTQTHLRHNLCPHAKETARVTDRKTTQQNSSHKRPPTEAESRGRSSLAVLLNTFATVGKSICPRGMSGEERICICVIW